MATISSCTRLLISRYSCKISFLPRDRTAGQSGLRLGKAEKLRGPDTEFGVSPGIEPPPHHLPAQCPQANHCLSSNLYFLLCVMGALGVIVRPGEIHVQSVRYTHEALFNCELRSCLPRTAGPTAGLWGSNMHTPLMCCDPAFMSLVPAPPQSSSLK